MFHAQIRTINYLNGKAYGIAEDTMTHVFELVPS